MRKVCIVALAGAATLAVATPAVAQTPDLVITPLGGIKATGKGKATPKKPKIITAARSGFTANAEAKKTISEMRFFLPATVKLSGKGFPVCSAAVLAQGTAGCPKGSQVGAGTASAQLGGPNPQPLKFETKLFNGGGNKLTLFTAGVGTDVGVPIEATIKKAKKPYGQELVVPIPTSLQSPAPSLYSYITGVDTTINGKIKKGGKTTSYAKLTGCPKDKKHHFGIQLVETTNDIGPGGVTDIVDKTTKCKA